MTRFLTVVAFVLISVVSALAQNNPKKWTLNECVDYAIKNNLNVKQNELDTQIQELEIQRAKNNFLPNVSGTFGADYDFGTPDTNNSFSNSIGIGANATLYNGNRTKNAIASTEKYTKISKLSVEILKNDLAVQVLSAYLNVIYSREGVKIAQDQLSVGQKLLDRMTELVNAGVKAKNDLFQVQATLASNEESLVTAQNNLDLALLNLSQLIQVSNVGFDIADVPITINQVQLKYENSEMIYKEALVWRPEVRLANKQIEASELDIIIAKSGFLPTVTANYSFGTRFLDIQNIHTESDYFKQIADNRGHSIGLTAAFPIFDKYSTKINTQRAQIQKLKSQTSLENEKFKLRTEIEKAYIDAKTSLKTFEAAKKSVEAQEENFRTAQERYNMGVLTSFDFEQVRNQLVLAQSSFIRAKYNYIFKSKFLEIYYGLPISL